MFCAPELPALVSALGFDTLAQRIHRRADDAAERLRHFGDRGRPADRSIRLAFVDLLAGGRMPATDQKEVISLLH
jgi:hypothetical protein